MGREIQPAQGADIVDMSAWKKSDTREKSVDLVQDLKFGSDKDIMAALLRRLYPEQDIDIDKLY